MISLTRFVLAHKRLVAAFWLAVALVGVGAAGKATKAFSDQYSVPGREGYETNAAISRTFGNGGNSPPLVPVVTLARGVSVNSTSTRRGLAEVAARIEHAVPRARIASYASTGDRAFVSGDGRTTFLLAYPRRSRAASVRTRRP
jgi:RND superfamily putative drug exporter